MKKTIILTTIISIFLLSCNQSVKKTDDKQQDNRIVNIPDANFKAVLVRDSLINTNGDGEIQVSEALACTTIDVRNSDISDLTGIEEFTALTVLACIDNQLTKLDVSSNTALQKIYCEDNQLTTLDVSKNKALTNLWCNSNQLTNLDVGSNTSLNELYCFDNQLTTLNVSHSTSLTILACNKNQLTTIDLSKNTALTELYCNNNQLTKLDVSTNTSLKKLFCDENPKLNCIEVDDVTWATANWKGIDSHTSFSNDCK